MARILKSISYLIIISGFIFISGLYSSIKAEAVFMNDGSIVEGKVIKDTDKFITIKPNNAPAKNIQRKDLIRVLYSDDYMNRVYIYKLDDTLVEGYIVYEDRMNYTIRENLTSANELTLAKDKVNFISKKKVTPVIIEKKVEVEVEKKPDTEEKFRLFGIDWGIGLGFPVYLVPTYYFSDETGANTNNFPTTIISLFGIKIHTFFDFRFNIFSWLSAGAEIGINFFPNAANLSGDYGYTVYPAFNLDIPLRGFVRFGKKNYYGQLFGGYYLGVFPILSIGSNAYYERGGELGTRINLWGFFLEFSFVFANIEAKNLDHLRFALGYTGRIF
jgi:hypothetical protein